MKRTIVLPASFEQGEEVMEHHLTGHPVRIVPGETARISRAAQRLYPGCKVVSANLDVESADWQVTIESAS